MFRLLTVCLVLGITACATTPEVEIVQPKKKKTPSTKTVDLDNACDIFAKNPDWLVSTLESSRQWQVPIFVMLAIIHQESRFVATARPLNPDKNSKKKYASSAYGYAQALDGTWKEYQKKTGNSRSRRDDFASAVDFIGWYILQAHKTNGISKWATDKVYLNYHEGMGGYKRKTYRRKPWLVKVAAKVKRRGSQYARQLKSCNIPFYVKKNGRLPEVKKGQDNLIDGKVRETLYSKGWF